MAPFTSPVAADQADSPRFATTMRARLPEAQQGWRAPGGVRLWVAERPVGGSGGADRTVEALSLHLCASLTSACEIACFWGVLGV
eukprot:5752964-Prymnesium_polylepis.1